MVIPICCFHAAGDVAPGIDDLGIDDLFILLMIYD